VVTAYGYDDGGSGMAKAVKLCTTEGEFVYISCEEVIALIEREERISIYLSMSYVVHVKGVDMDDLAAVFWSNRPFSPRGHSRRNLPEGTVL
jgi:hypothetical protein